MKFASLILLVAGFAILTGCATSSSVHQVELLTSTNAASLSSNLSNLARHQDAVVGFLNNNLDLYQSAIQTNATKASSGALVVSQQEKVGRVMDLLASESEAHAQAYFAAAAVPGVSADSTAKLAAARKAILDSLDSVNSNLAALGQGLSPVQRLQFILGYAEDVAARINQAQNDAAKSADTGAGKIVTSTGKSTKTTP